MLRSVCVLLCFLLHLATTGFAEPPRYEVLFNGKDLSGWNGIKSLWTVEEGSIVGDPSDKRYKK